MRPRHRTLLAKVAFTAILGLGLTVSPAVAQQPAERPLNPAGGVQPGPGSPRPGPQPGGQPGQVPPGPGRQPPPRPGQMPPGQRPPGLMPPRQPGAGRLVAPPPAAHAKPAAAHAAAGHCPGHGPMDPPGHINWYQGIIGVDNQRAVQGNFMQKLFWRYKNTDDECDPKNQEPPILASALNLAVVIFVLYRFGKAPLKEALVKRKRDMMQDIDAATELKAKAEERLVSYKKQLARIEDRRKELHAEYRAQGEAEHKRLIAEAEEKSARLRRDAELRVAQEGRQVEADLLREATLAAVAAAEELLIKRIQAADHDRLADEYVANVGAAIKASATAVRSA